MNKVIFLQKVIYIIGTLGILTGIDLLFGAKIISNFNKILNRTVLDFDKIITGIFSHFRKTVDSIINVDEKIIKTQTRVVLGSLLIVAGVVLIFLIRKI